MNVVNAVNVGASLTAVMFTVVLPLAVSAPSVERGGGPLGYLVLGAALLTEHAVTGAGLHLVMHAWGKITLFFAAGALYTAAKITETRDLAGMGRKMPWTMAAFTIGALGMIGVPPVAGFVTKWYLLVGSMQAHQLGILLILLSAQSVVDNRHHLIIASITGLAGFGLEVVEYIKTLGANEDQV